MKTLLFLLGLALAPALFSPARAGVYFAAHQDDIVLLMGRSALADIRSGAPTVLVVLTAGDAGNGQAPVTVTGIGMRYYNQSGNPYYRVRHNAHEAAISVWVPAAQSRLPQRSTEFFGALTPAVEKVRIGNVLMYNLNLPDGMLDRFYSGSIGPMKDVTGRNHYTVAGLQELLRQVVSRNSGGTAAPIVHLPEHTPSFSAPGYNEGKEAQLRADHPDHTAVGRLVRDALAAPGHACVRQVVYMGYGISAGPDSMSTLEKLAQVQAYAALDQVLRDQGNVTYRHEAGAVMPGAMDGFHMSFYGKQRWRDGGGGSGSCAFAPLLIRGDSMRTARRLRQ